MPMEERQKKMIVGGIVSAVIVGLVIFLILFFGEIGPFSKYIAPDDFWKKVEEIVEEEKTYNEQWYVKSERKGDKDMWSVELFGSKDKDRANDKNAEKTLSDGKIFARSKMTKAQNEDCSANFEVIKIHEKRDTKSEVTSYISHLIKHVEAAAFWKSVEEIRQRSEKIKQWYTKATHIQDDSEYWYVELYGSRNDKLADETNIEMTIKDGEKYMSSMMKMKTVDDFHAEHKAVCSLMTKAIGWAIKNADGKDVQYHSLKPTETI